jgi:hypothetical protein
LRKDALDAKEGKEADKKKAAKAKDAPFVNAFNGIGTATGNQTAVNALFNVDKAKTLQQQMNTLSSVVSDSFLNSQRQQGQGYIQAIAAKFLKGDKEAMNMYYNNIDPAKLKKRILGNMSEETAEALINSMRGR